MQSFSVFFEDEKSSKLKTAGKIALGIGAAAALTGLGYKLGQKTNKPESDQNNKIQPIPDITEPKNRLYYTSLSTES